MGTFYQNTRLEMALRILLLFIMCVTASLTNDIPQPNESVQDVLKRLEQKISKNQQMETIMAAEISKLKSEIDHLKTGKIKQSLLPGGYSDFTVEDLQWQSLHMAAAAACRGSTASGGTGPWNNFVFPRNSKQTCNDICQERHLVCDATVSLQGYVGRAKKY